MMTSTAGAWWLIITRKASRDAARASSCTSGSRAERGPPVAPRWIRRRWRMCCAGSTRTSARRLSNCHEPNSSVCGKPGGSRLDAAFPAFPRIFPPFNFSEAIVMEKLQRDVRLLKAYAFVVTLLLGILAFVAFSQANQKTKFTEIDVE